jgi:transposase-like protein
VTKQIARTGRPPKRPPADAAERIRELSADGHSTVAIAQQLGVGRKTLDKWRAEFPALDEAYREGVDRERYELHSGLVAKAKAGNIVAAIFLLKARHGYREGDQDDQAGRVSVNIALPGAMTLQQFNAIAAPQGSAPAIEKGTEQ